MTISRREMLAMSGAVILFPLKNLIEEAAASGDYLWGTWYVRCPAGHDDKVTDGTAQHKCEKWDCGKQCFRDGKVTVVCPKGHPNEIILKSRTESFICKTDGCKLECCRGHD
jgi:hypothetical protein